VDFIAASVILVLPFVSVWAQYKMTSALPYILQPPFRSATTGPTVQSITAYYHLLLPFMPLKCNVRIGHQFS